MGPYSRPGGTTENCEGKVPTRLPAGRRRYDLRRFRTAGFRGARFKRVVLGSLAFGRISTTEFPFPTIAIFANAMNSPCSTTPGVSLNARASAAGSAILPKLQSRM